ncbi:MAG: hypothetical protein JNK72_00505 [Myxococcales bacterium]|nr:hypothetical protein [Myxococcales bacterium]
MKKNNVVPGAIVAVVVAVGALAGTAVYLVKHRNAQNTATAARLSPDSVSVVRLNVEALRAFAPAQSLRNEIMGNQQSAALREARTRYEEANRACGGELWQTLRGLTVGVDKSLTEARNPSAWVAYLDTSLNAEQARRCAEYFVSQARSGETLAASELSGQTVYSPVRPGAQPGNREATLYFAEHTAALTERSYMGTVIGLLRGTSPGLGTDHRLNVMLRQLGGPNMLDGAVDLQQIRQQNAQSVNEAVDTLVRENPGQPDLTLARQLVTGGMALRQNNGGIVFEARGAFLQATVARPFTAAVEALIQARRSQAITTLEEVQGQLRGPAALLALGNASLRQQLDDVNAGLDALRASLNQITTRTDDLTTVVTLTMTPPQVQAVERAIRSGGTLAEEMMGSRAARRRANPFPGGPFGAELGTPPPDDRGERAPTPEPQAQGDAGAAR